MPEPTFLHELADQRNGDGHQDRAEVEPAADPAAAADAAPPVAADPADNLFAVHSAAPEPSHAPEEKPGAPSLDDAMSFIADTGKLVRQAAADVADVVRRRRPSSLPTPRVPRGFSPRLPRGFSRARVMAGGAVLAAFAALAALVLFSRGSDRKEPTVASVSRPAKHAAPEREAAAPNRPEPRPRVFAHPPERKHRAKPRHRRAHRRTHARRPRRARRSVPTAAPAPAAPAPAPVATPPAPTPAPAAPAAPSGGGSQEFGFEQ